LFVIIVIRYGYDANLFNCTLVRAESQLFGVVVTMFGFGIPLALKLLAYGHIFAVVYRQRKRIAGHTRTKANANTPARNGAMTTTSTGDSNSTVTARKNGMASTSTTDSNDTATTRNTTTTTTTLSGHSNPNPTNPAPNSTSQRHRTELRLTLVCCALVAVYIVSFVPFAVASASPALERMDRLHAVATVLQSVHILVNPVLYLYGDGQMRSKIAGMFARRNVSQRRRIVSMSIDN
jgi:hypothetical protein